MLKSGWKQLFDIGPWETMGVEGPFSNWLAETRAIALSQADNEALGAGMQMNNQLPVTTINSYLNKLYLGSIIGLFIALPFLSSARGLILYVLISLYVQACFTGGLSIVTGRYQLRVSWLPVFCLMFVLAKLISSPALSDRDYETNG